MREISSHPLPPPAVLPAVRNVCNQAVSLWLQELAAKLVAQGVPLPEMEVQASVQQTPRTAASGIDRGATASGANGGDGLKRKDQTYEVDGLVRHQLAACLHHGLCLAAVLHHGSSRRVMIRGGDAERTTRQPAFCCTLPLHPSSRSPRRRS